MLKEAAANCTAGCMPAEDDVNEDDDDDEEDYEEEGSIIHMPMKDYFK